jgi:hypothetical protein
MAAVHLVEAALVHFQQTQRLARDRERDGTVSADEREVANAPEQPVRDARRSSRAARDLERGIVVHGRAEDAGRALDDAQQVGVP